MLSELRVLLRGPRRSVFIFGVSIFFHGRGVEGDDSRIGKIITSFPLVMPHAPSIGAKWSTCRCTTTYWLVKGEHVNGPKVRKRLSRGILALMVKRGAGCFGVLQLAVLMKASGSVIGWRKKGQRKIIISTVDFEASFSILFRWWLRRSLFVSGRHVFLGFELMTPTNDTRVNVSRWDRSILFDKTVGYRFSFLYFVVKVYT